MDVTARGAIGLGATNPGPVAKRDGGGFEAILGATDTTSAPTSVSGAGAQSDEAQPVLPGASGPVYPAVWGGDLTAPALSVPQPPAAATKIPLLASAAVVGVSSTDTPVDETGSEGALATSADASMLLETGESAKAKDLMADVEHDKTGTDAQMDPALLAASLSTEQPDSEPASLPDAPVESVMTVPQSQEDTTDALTGAAVDATALLSNKLSLAQTAVPAPHVQAQPHTTEQTAEEQQDLAATSKQVGKPAGEGGAIGSSPAGASAEPAVQPFAQLMRNSAADQPQANAAALPGSTNPASPQAQLGSQPAAEAQAPAQPQPVIPFRADKVAREMGLEIARRVSTGGEELVIRLDPGELGRINIRMAVNEHGHLRAVVAADAPAVLEALRSDISELNRALEQAGVRTDSQSFRFDRGGSGDSGGQWQQRYQQQASSRQGGAHGSAIPEDEHVYRPMATNGRINMMA